MAHILLVDDDDQFRDMVTLMLKQDQHQLTIAKNGEEAFKLAKAQRFELIITDILMPGMDGIELIRALNQQQFPTPIIALSGGRRNITADFNLESAELIGVATTLAKPFSRQDLRTAIQKALS